MELERLRLRSCTRWYYKYYSFRGSFTFFFLDLSVLYIYFFNICRVGITVYQKKIFFVFIYVFVEDEENFIRVVQFIRRIDVKLFRLFERKKF